MVCFAKRTNAIPKEVLEQSAFGERNLHIHTAYKTVIITSANTPTPTFHSMTSIIWPSMQRLIASVSSMAAWTVSRCCCSASDTAWSIRRRQRTGCCRSPFISRSSANVQSQPCSSNVSCVAVSDTDTDSGSRTDLEAVVDTALRMSAPYLVLHITYEALESGATETFTALELLQSAVHVALRLEGDAERQQQAHALPRLAVCTQSLSASTNREEDSISTFGHDGLEDGDGALGDRQRVEVEHLRLFQLALKRVQHRHLIGGGDQFTPAAFQLHLGLATQQQLHLLQRNLGGALACTATDTDTR